MALVLNTPFLERPGHLIYVFIRLIYRQSATEPQQHPGSLRDRKLRPSQLSMFI